MEHKNNFDLIRLLAAFDVMLQHAAHLQIVWPVPLAKLIVYSTGVPIFFIVSGFLITGTFFRNQRIAPYLINRSLRIYPALWLNISIILVMLVAFGALPVESILDPEFLQYWGVMLATGSHTFAGWLAGPFPFLWNDAMPFMPTGALWTIILELGFYLIVPVIVTRWRSVSLVAVVTMTACSYAISLDTPGSSVAQYTDPLAYFWMFGIGSIAALVWPWIDRLFRGKFIVWVALYVGAIIATGDQAGILFFHPTPQSTMLTILLAGCVLSAAFTGVGLSKSLLSGNDISYGIYLHHMPIVLLLRAFGWNGYTGAALLIGMTTMAATASWFVVERPMLALKPKARRTDEPRTLLTVQPQPS